jgi:hypothetical protein
MTETLIKINEGKFEKRFELVTNHIDPSAGWAYGESNGCLFETYGEEFAPVNQSDYRKAWTLTDGEGDSIYLIPAVHLVNRVGYLVSRNILPDETIVIVTLDTQPDDEGSPLPRQCVTTCYLGGARQDLASLPLQAAKCPAQRPLTNVLTASGKKPCCSGFDRLGR